MYKSQDVVQVNIPAESGEMGVLANHVPSIEQLKPGLIEVIEESGGSKQFFRTWTIEDFLSVAN
jgi:F-type H+-transporting ATPase subunit delta